MVGSGGGGGGGGGGRTGGGGGTPIDCSRLVFKATVASPIPAVVATAAVGDVCDLELLTGPPRIVLLTRPARETLGAITDRWQDLVACIGQGVSFEAEILQVTPFVRVEVRPAR